MKKPKSKAKSVSKTSRTYNFQKKKSDISPGRSDDGYKPIKNPDKIFEMKWSIIEQAGDIDFILRNNRGQSTQRFMIETENGRLPERDQDTVIDIAKFLGFKPSVLGLKSSKYRKAVEFLKDNENEKFEGRSFETIFNRVKQLIENENFINHQHDADKTQQAIRHARGEM